MLAAGRGTIVCTGSVDAVLPDPPVLDYSGPRPPCTTSPRASPRSSGPAGSASTRSRRDRCRRTCGSATRAWPPASGPPAPML
ncbi:hypothetical protein NKG05_28470 [Oerskovia sp. M15]